MHRWCKCRNPQGYLQDYPQDYPQDYQFVSLSVCQFVRRSVPQ
jgi:hypothetical protein